MITYQPCHAQYLDHHRSRSESIIVPSIDFIDESCHSLRVTLGSGIRQEKVQKIGNASTSDGNQ